MIEWETFFINYDRYFEEYIGDAELQVRVYKNSEDLHKVRGRDDLVDAYMNILDGQMVMHFSADRIAMALIVHESIHAMFWNYDRLSWGKKKPRKKISIFNHPERMVHFGGNLATIVYGVVTEKYEVVV